MTDFSVSAAAFSGFHFIREKPLTIVIWAVAYVVLMVLLFGVFFGLAGAAFIPLFTNPQALENNPGAALQALPGLLGAMAVFLVVGILAGGVIYAAAYRAFLRPEEGPPSYFKFGADEVRLVGAYLLLVLIYMAFSIVSTIVAGVAGVAGGDSGGVIAILLNLIFFCVTVWGAVRLSLALPATFVSRRMGLAESWRLTKGRFWKLLGAYLIAGVLLFAAYIAVIIVVFAVGGTAFASLSAGANPMQVMATSIPLIIVILLLYPVIGACALAVMIGPTASIYAQLTQDPSKTAEAFT